MWALCVRARGAGGAVGSGRADGHVAAGTPGAGPPGRGSCLWAHHGRAPLPTAPGDRRRTSAGGAVGPSAGCRLIPLRCDSPLVDARRCRVADAAAHREGGRNTLLRGRSGGVSKLPRRGPRSRGHPVRKRRALSKALQPIRIRYVQEVNISACGGGFQGEAGTKSPLLERLSYRVDRGLCVLPTHYHSSVHAYGTSICTSEKRPDMSFPALWSMCCLSHADTVSALARSSVASASTVDGRTANRIAGLHVT